jgi:putative ABC transport system ATP-binding protein
MYLWRSKAGEIVCILGTSGSGKSTLLNLLAGLEKPTRGEIVVLGKHIHKMDEQQLARFRQKYLGFIFQSYHLLSAVTALENVSLPLTFQGTARPIRKKTGCRDAQGSRSGQTPETTNRRK